MKHKKLEQHDDYYMNELESTLSQDSLFVIFLINNETKLQLSVGARLVQ